MKKGNVGFVTVETYHGARGMLIAMFLKLLSLTGKADFAQNCATSVL
jgi:hypothetical protein